MALNKLRGELKAAGVKQYEAASLLGMTANNFSRKLAEAVPFTRDEMFKLQSEYFPSLTLEHLFQSDGNVPTEAESLHAQVDAMADQMRHADIDEGDVVEIEDAFHEVVNEWERCEGRGDEEERQGVCA